MAEEIAMLEALRFCVDNEYVLIDLHTDSMVLKKVIAEEWTVPWSISEEVEEIKELMTRCNVMVSHTLIEGNNLADHLANYALDVGPIEEHKHSRKEDSEC